MIVSTKGRYALRVMVFLAKRTDRDYVPVKEIAEQEEISQKYLESIMTILSKAGFLRAVQGKGRRLPAQPGPGGIYRGQHSEADGGQPGTGVLHYPWSFGLFPDRLLRHIAHVGEAGQAHRRLFREHHPGGPIKNA